MQESTQEHHNYYYKVIIICLTKMKTTPLTMKAIGPMEISGLLTRIRQRYHERFLSPLNTSSSLTAVVFDTFRMTSGKGKGPRVRPDYLRDPYTPS
jgi:hypothetical protein